MSASRISSRTIREWKKQGFTFEKETEGVGLTEVKFGGKPFYFFRTRYLDDTYKLMSLLDKELEKADGNRMLVAGQYDEDDYFPFYLVTPESHDKMIQARETFNRIHELLNQSQTAFATALFDPVTYQAVTLAE